MEVAGLVIAVTLLLVALAFGVSREAHAGRSAGRVGRVSTASDALLTRLGVRPGTVTLLQFSSAFCAPCRAVRVICTEVARTSPHVTHVEIDAESHLTAVRALGIQRTPTVLIVAPDGKIVDRVHGVPKLRYIRDTVGVLHA